MYGPKENVLKRSKPTRQQKLTLMEEEKKRRRRRSRREEARSEPWRTPSDDTSHHKSHQKDLRIITILLLLLYKRPKILLLICSIDSSVYYYQILDKHTVRACSTMLSSEAGPSQRPRSTSRLERLRGTNDELEAIEASRKQAQAQKERLLKDFEEAVRDEKALKAKYEELQAVRATDLPEVEGVPREKMRRDIVMMRLKQQPLIQPQPEHLSDECDRDEVEQWIEEVNKYYRAMHMAPEQTCPRSAR